jgi:hypothetical protein
MVNDYTVILSIFGEGSFIKTLVIGGVATCVFIIMWTSISTDAKKIILAVFASIGWGFLLGGLIDRIGGGKK